MAVNRKKWSASNEVSSAKSKQPRAYSVQQTDSDENKQGTAIGKGEKNNDIQQATGIWEQRTVISFLEQSNSNKSWEACGE